MHPAMPPSAPVPAAPAASPSFEAIVERLGAIAGRLERDDVPLEEALGLYEEGMRLSRAGTHRLDDAERRLEVLQEGGEVQPYVARDG